MKKLWETLSPWLLTVLLVVLGAVTSAGLQYLAMRTAWFPRDASGLPNSADMTSMHVLVLIFIQVISFFFWTAIFIRFAKFKWYVFEFTFGIKEFLIAFGALLVVNMLAGFLVKLSGIEPRQFENLNKSILASAPVPFLLAVSLLAPVYEEFVFRGVLFANLIERAKSTFAQVMAWIVPAVLFTLLHFEKVEQIIVLLPVFLLALLFTAITWQQKNIALSVIVHGIQNAIAGYSFLFLEI